MCDLYVRYQAVLGELAESNGKFDMVDACTNIVERSRKFASDEMLNSTIGRGYAGRAVDALFVDESQDLLSAQLRLLRVLVKDPSACTFAADAAQCIAHGRAFR